MGLTASCEELLTAAGLRARGKWFSSFQQAPFPTTGTGVNQGCFRCRRRKEGWAGRNQLDMAA